MRTIIGVCLDESGSMDEGGKREAAISAFNEYLRDQQKLTTDECLMTITKFNVQAVKALALTPIAKVPDLDKSNYSPGGGTALFDALVKCVREIEKDVLAGDRIVLVTLTDGEENSSQNATLQQVRDTIEGKEATGTWTFVFLSASLDAFAQGAAMGFQPGNVASYQNTATGTAGAMAAMSHGTTSYRLGATSASASFMGGQTHIPARPVTSKRPQPPTPKQRLQPPTPPVAVVDDNSNQPLQPMQPKP